MGGSETVPRHVLDIKTQIQERKYNLSDKDGCMDGDGDGIRYVKQNHTYGKLKKMQVRSF